MIASLRRPWRTVPRGIPTRLPYLCPCAGTGDLEQPGHERTRVFRIVESRPRARFSSENIHALACCFEQLCDHRGGVFRVPVSGTDRGQPHTERSVSLKGTGGHARIISPGADSHYGVNLDPILATQIAIISASLLGTIVGLLLLYLVIRLAVSHALRSHDDRSHSNAR